MAQTTRHRLAPWKGCGLTRPASANSCLSWSPHPSPRGGEDSKYIRLDLHKHHSQVAVKTKDGDLTAEYRIDHEPGEFEAFADEIAGSKVAMEATGSCRYVYEILDQMMDVTLVNPSQTRDIAEAKVKTDSIYAKMLAHLLRTDLVAESYVPPEEIRLARDLVRAR